MLKSILSIKSGDQRRWFRKCNSFIQWKNKAVDQLFSLWGNARFDTNKRSKSAFHVNAKIQFIYHIKRPQARRYQKCSSFIQRRQKAAARLIFFFLRQCKIYRIERLYLHFQHIKTRTLSNWSLKLNEAVYIILSAS